MIDIPSSNWMHDVASITYDQFKFKLILESIMYIYIPHTVSFTSLSVLLYHAFLFNLYMYMISLY